MIHLFYQNVGPNAHCMLFLVSKLLSKRHPWSLHCFPMNKGLVQAERYIWRSTATNRVSLTFGRVSYMHRNAWNFTWPQLGRGWVKKCSDNINEISCAIFQYIIGFLFYSTDFKAVRPYKNQFSKPGNWSKQYKPNALALLQINSSVY